MKIKTKELVIAAILTAISLIIPMIFTFPPLRLQLGPSYTATLAVHAPTLLSMFISPFAAVAVALSSAVGFFFTAPLVVAVRALTHVVFAFIGAYLIKKRVNVWIVLIVTTLTHALCEGVVVFVFYAAGLLPVNEIGMAMDVIMNIAGTMVHNIIDFFIALAIYYPVKKAKLADFQPIVYRELIGRTDKKAEADA